MAYRRKYWEYHRINDKGMEEKQCQDCKEYFLMNSENFGTDNGNKDKYSSRCKTCYHKYNHAIYMSDRENNIAKASKRQRDNIEAVLLYMKEVVRPRDGDKIRARDKEWRKRNKEYISEYYKEWQLKNPDKVNENTRYRTMHKTHKITAKEWKACKHYFNMRCAYCGLPIEEHFNKYRGKISIHDFHKEHVIHNGGNGLENCVPSCKSCNSLKHDSDFDKWYNETNINFTHERLEKILKWIYEDYRLYIQE